MGIWDTAQRMIGGAFRHGDGITWALTADGVSVEGQAAQVGNVDAAAATLTEFGSDIRAQAAAYAVPVELLAASKLVDGADLAAAASEITGAASVTLLQPPLVAAAYQIGIQYDAVSRWRMASYNRDAGRIDRYIETFNAAVAACAADSLLYRTAPAFAPVLALLVGPQASAPTPLPGTLLLADSVTAREQGLMIQSDSHPAIVGTWSLDQRTLDEIGSVARDSAAGLGLPMGAPYFAYPDKASHQHVMTGSDVEALYRALRDHVAAIYAYDTGRASSLPGQPAFV